MRILLAGGSGYVGTMVAPYLKGEHALRILDLAPPKDTALDYVQGSGVWRFSMLAVAVLRGAGDRFSGVRVV